MLTLQFQPYNKSLIKVAEMFLLNRVTTLTKNKAISDRLNKCGSKKWIIITRKKGVIICEGGMLLGSLKPYLYKQSNRNRNLEKDSENGSWNNTSQLVEHKK